MVDEKNKSNVPDVIHVKSLQHRVDLINNNKVVIIYYHAEWCGPCKTFAPDFNDLAQKYLNWEPNIEPGVGLEKTIKYFASVI